jgi:hypothetical protein
MERGYEILKMGGDKNGSESCPVAGFGINGVESSSFTTRERQYIFCLRRFENRNIKFTGMLFTVF